MPMVVNKNVNKSRILWIELGNIIASKLAQVKNNIPKKFIEFLLFMLITNKSISKLNLDYYFKTKGMII